MRGEMLLDDLQLEAGWRERRLSFRRLIEMHSWILVDVESLLDDIDDHRLSLQASCGLQTLVYRNMFMCRFTGVRYVHVCTYLHFCVFICTYICKCAGIRSIQNVCPHSFRCMCTDVNSHVKCAYAC